MFARKRHYVIACLLLLIGCHKGYDPLAERRDALLMLDTTVDSVPPTRHVVAELSKAQLDSLVSDVVTIQRQSLERVHLSGPMGIPMEAVNTVDEVSLKASQGTCEGCRHFGIAAAGNSVLGSALSSLKASMTWDVSVDGGFALEADSERLLLHPTEDWTLGVEVSGLPDMMNATVEATVKNMMAEVIQTQGLTQPIVLYSELDRLPVEVQRVAFQAHPGVAVSGTAQVLRGTDIAERAPIEQGWSARVSGESLAGILDAFLLQQPPTNGYATQVHTVRVDDGVVIELDVVRATPRAPSRRVTLKVILDVDDQFTVRVAHAHLASPQKGWRTVGMRLVGDKRLRKSFTKLLEQELSSVLDTNLGTMTLRTRILDVISTEGVLEIVGDMSISSNDIETEDDAVVPTVE